MARTSYFAVITDQHIVEPGSTLYGLNTRASAETLVEHLRQEKVSLSGIVSLGDLADTARNSDRMAAVGSREAYALARDVFSEIKAPFFCIPGNHDDPSIMNEFFPPAWTNHRDGIHYSTIAGTTLIGIDLRTGPEPTGLATQESLTILDEVLRESEKSVVFSHYPLFDLDNQRIDDKLSTLNRGEVQQVLQRYKHKVAGCFHGHLHLWITGYRDGILTHGVPSSSFTFLLEPQSTVHETVSDHPTGYLLFGINDDGSILIRPRFLPSAQRV